MPRHARVALAVQLFPRPRVRGTPQKRPRKGTRRESIDPSDDASFELLTFDGKPVRRECPALPARSSWATRDRRGRGGIEPSRKGRERGGRTAPSQLVDVLKEWDVGSEG